ncbi:MFS transporter [Actinoplanes sp. SE50]|uniref:MFS transporter n=1 Tax=unclassified Actinoplanes TaxID=2626549 RepID=UPI00023ECAD3|nr:MULTISPECIES: MFS transporter [unclassified Actinoplanes]AEV83174.1 putative sugar efflux transporter [Actinoplanes sp. SE50/110]ATO81567.1 MFS transporter [Actinoplanes sp. SE50]SLL98975.1 MFS transporter [Actinoplanes sp. SE50/110]
MDHVTGRQRGTALVALALGGVAIGLTEFVAMGLLPEMTRDLLPAAWARSHEDAVAQAGWVITTYALGVVAGAPLIAALSARMPRKRLVLGLLALFTVGTVASALAPTFGLVLVARFVAALPHGAYFGAAGLVAANLMGPGNEARGFAVVLGGLTLSNVAGVPVITLIGQSSGWRVAYLVIAGVFLLALFAVLATVPQTPTPAGASIGAELRALRRPQVWLVAVTAAVGFGGFFAVDSYIAPVTTEVTGLSTRAVPWALVAVGLGMTVGNAVGGWFADRNLRRATLTAFSTVIVAAVIFALTAHSTVGLFLGSFLVGAASLALGPAMQARLIAVAPGAQLMGAAVNQSAMNTANGLGAALGGLVIARGYGYLAPAWTGAVLAAIGLGLAAVSFAADRTFRRSLTAVHHRRPTLWR